MDWMSFLLGLMSSFALLGFVAVAAALAQMKKKK
jgi:hypothetical protein